MSDIIYTPPASGGGGQNPTTNYIPLNNGTSNFVDSSILNNKNANFLQTEFNSVFGLYLIDDGSNVGAYLGDFNYNYHGAYIQVNDTNRFIEINASDNYTATSLFLDDINQIIKTRNAGKDIGFYLDFVNFQFIFGDINNDFNGTKILMDDNYRYINIIANPITFWIDGLMNVSYFNYNGNDIGLKLDFANNLYFLGDYNGLTNSTQIIINNGNKDITLWAENSLQLKGAGLQSASAGGSSGDHLVIYLNGTQYKIALLNP